jgi:hypothetical protein
MASGFDVTQLCSKKYHPTSGVIILTPARCGITLRRKRTVG